ncbi:MAG: hypothetical protein K0S55_813 [Clostridia bacterium]|nr:hypothetical protein [Clostridia bacterium]
MSNENIFFIEGLPGTGKTTTSEWLHKNIGGKLISESSQGYPNDLYNIAGLPFKEYSELKIKFPIISDYTEKHGLYQYVNINKIIEQKPDEKELCNELMKWDLGDERNLFITAKHFINCSLDILKDRIVEFDNNNENIIMDSVWLQNPLNELLLRNIGDNEAEEYCLSFIKSLKKISPVCIYLRRENPISSIRFACKTKGEEWTKRISEFLPTTPYGIANSLKGIDGVERYFSKRAEIEERIISKGIVKALVINIDKVSWEVAHSDILSSISR